MKHIPVQLYKNTFRILVNPKAFFAELINLDKYRISLIKLAVYYLLFEVVYQVFLLSRGVSIFSETFLPEYILLTILHFAVTFASLLAVQYILALFLKGCRELRLHFYIASNLMILYPFCVFIFFPELINFFFWQIITLAMCILLIFMFYHIMKYALKIPVRRVTMVVSIACCLLTLSATAWILFWKYYGHLP